MQYKKGELSDAEKSIEKTMSILVELSYNSTLTKEQRRACAIGSKLAAIELCELRAKHQQYLVKKTRESLVETVTGRPSKRTQKLCDMFKAKAEAETKSF